MSDPHAQARARIRPIKQAVEDDLLSRKNVVGVDIAEKEVGGEKTGELSIVVFVDSKKPPSKVPSKDRVPAEIDGVQTDVQEIEVELQSGAARLLDETFTPFVDPAQYGTLEGGISIGPLRSVHLDPPDVPASGSYVFVGTLGAMVRDRSTGATMALTNFHVACVNNTWSVGDRQVQQSLVDGGSASGQFGSLTRATLSELVDGSVITVDSGKAWSATIHDVGTVAGHTAATVGMAVQKRGRTTEHTFGTVVSTDFTVTINYGSDVGLHTLRHQIRIQTDTTKSTRFSDHGDSGSVVVNDSRQVVGLLFGGSNDGTWTFANPIQSALDELGVDLLTGPVVLASKPVLACLNTKLPTICNIQLTKTPICYPVRSRVTICLTKGSPICDLVVVSKPPCLPPRLTLACGDEWRPPIDWNPGGIGRGGYGGYGDAAPDTDEVFLAGYLSALEEVDAADQGTEG